VINVHEYRASTWKRIITVIDMRVFFIKYARVMDRSQLPALIIRDLRRAIYIATRLRANEITCKE